MAECLAMFEKALLIKYQIYSYIYIVVFNAVAYYHNQSPININQQAITGFTFKKVIICVLISFAIQSVKYNYMSIGMELFKRVEEECKIVEQNVRERETFFACMSHEIRNPTQAIVGALELLFPIIPRTSENSRLIEIAKGGCEMVMSLISNILDFSKLRAGKMELSLSPCNLESAVNKTVQLLKPKAESKGLYLKFIKSPISKLPDALDLDFRKIGQVILNLITNAIKFTQNGGITVSLSWNWDDEIHSDDDLIVPDEGETNMKNKKYCLPNSSTNLCIRSLAKDVHHKKSDTKRDLLKSAEATKYPQCNSGYVAISVTDTGIGIAQEKILNLFNLFTQADSSISRHFF